MDVRLVRAAWWTTLALLLVPWLYLPYPVADAVGGCVCSDWPALADAAIVTGRTIVVSLLACLLVLGAASIRAVRRRGQAVAAAAGLTVLVALLAAYQWFLGHLGWGLYMTA